MTDSVDRTATVARRDAVADVLAGVRFPAAQFHDEAVRIVVEIEADMILAALDAHDSAHPQDVVDRLVAAGVLERCRVKSENRVTHVYVEVVPDPDGPLYRVVPS